MFRISIARLSVALLALLLLGLFGSRISCWAAPRSRRSVIYQQLLNEVSKGQYEALKELEPEEAIRSVAMQKYKNFRWSELKELCSRMLDAQIKTSGEGSLRVAESFRMLGNIETTGNSPRFHAEAIQIQQRLLGFNNSMTCGTIYDAALASLHARCHHSLSNSLFWQQAIMLKKLYPGCSEMESVRKQNEDEQRILKNLPAESWIDEFARNWKNPDYKVPVFLTEIGGFEGTTGRLITKLTREERVGMRSLLAQELEAFKSLVCDHYSSYNYKRPRWEDYYDPCFFNIIANGADTPRPGSHSTVQEAEKALDDELGPGMIEYTPIEDSNKKTTGFFLRVGDPLTGKPLQTSGAKALVVFCGAEEFSKALSLRRLSRKFICGYSNSLILPIEFRPGIDQMLCPIQNTIWQPPGFSYFMPIEIEYKIDKSGIISGASFKKMCGIAEADKAALDFIRKCQYNPLLEINKDGLKGSCKFGTACANNRLLAAWPANSDWVEKLTPEEKDNKNLLAFWQYKISELEFGVPNSIHNPLTGSTQLPYESRSNDDVVKTSHAKPHIAPEFGSYMAEMQRLLLAQWDKVQVISKKNTTVMFTVKNDGGVTNLKIYKTSGSADCDKAALEAVRRADPLPPLPEHAPSQVDMTFLFDTIHERNSKPQAPIRK